MGLDCSHDAFHGAYSAFNRFRQAVARAAYGSFPPHEDLGLLRAIGVTNPDRDAFYLPDQSSPETQPGLWTLLAHSDCDGSLSPEECRQVADELEALLPALDLMGGGGGHLEHAGGIGAVARQFIAGCREAAERGEALEFR